MDLYLMSEMPAFSTAVVILILMSIYGGGAAPGERDRVGTLPGQPAAGELPFSHFSGYVELPAAGTKMPARHVFYHFVQSDNSSQPAAEAPLVIWFGSERFCSPIGYGGMLEVGPLRVQSDMTLVLNDNSWHKEANLLFVDLPAGVGLSYSERITAEVISDEQTSKDAVDFLHRWAEKFPQHREAELYLGGEGHGAHHPVRLAAQSMRDKALLPPGMQLRGILLGDPEMDLESTFLGFVDYLSAKGMMSQASRQKVLTTCILNSTADCGMAMHLEAIALGMEVSAIIEPLCSPSTHPTSKFLWFDPCSVNYLHEYLNLPTVQTALHANHSHRVPGPWKICSKNLRQGQLPPGSDKPNWITDTMRELA
ncbi:unnamed protein product [Linum trigynum]|uniref:Uncharacterized protein n=1 Tax=Linum trigynum TaxID=586398 RepID=A0AAV2FEP9_9ROSI